MSPTEKSSMQTFLGNISKHVNVNNENVFSNAISKPLQEPSLEHQKRVLTPGVSNSSSLNAGANDNNIFGSISDGNSSIPHRGDIKHQEANIPVDDNHNDRWSPFDWIDLPKMDGLTDMFSISCSAAVIFGGLIPYVPQYIKIKQSNNSDGFSTYGKSSEDSSRVH